MSSQRPNLHRHLRNDLLRQPLRPYLCQNPLPSLLTPPHPNPRRPHPARLRRRRSHIRIPIRPPPSPFRFCPIRLPALPHRLRHLTHAERCDEGRSVHGSLLCGDGLVHQSSAPLVHDGE